MGRWSQLACAAFALCNLACNARPDGALLVPPYLLVTPEELDFGPVPVGGRGVQVLELGNGGAWPLPINRFQVVDDSSGFAAPQGPSALDVGHKAFLELEFRPTQAGLLTATLEIEPDHEVAYFYLDPPLFPITVPLRGTGVSSTPTRPLVFSPNPVDFLTVPLGCGVSFEALEIRNVGSVPARFTRTVLEDPTGDFKYDETQLPRELGPGETARLDLQYSPAFEGTSEAVLHFEYRAQGASFEDEVRLVGHAAPDAMVVDGVGPETNTKRDILFVVDDSCSMQQEQDRLAENFAAFISIAEETSLDYHLGVTTTDAGDGNPAEAGRLVPLSGPASARVVTRQTSPSPEARFRANVSVGIDPSTQIEQGLEVMRLALSSPLRDGHNAGFLRDEADLAVVIVSDEDDQAPSPPESYVDFLRSLKPGRPNAVRLVTIGGPPPVGCLGPNGSAIGGIRYDIVGRLTGGRYESICTMDWAATLRSVSEATFGLPSSIFLTRPPVRSTITVVIDGRTLDLGEWRYDAPSNSVTLLTRTGRYAEVRYQALCS